MSVKELLLSQEELSLLASSVGSLWDHYGAQAAFEGGRYALVDMYVQTGSGALTIAAGLESLSLEGSPDEYAHLQVRDGAEGARIARKRGTVFVPDRGRTVTDVLIVRDRVSASAPGHDGFELVADVGVVFVLDRGVVAVLLGGPFASDLLILRAPDMDSLVLNDTSADWGEGISCQLTITREVMHIGSAWQTGAH